MKSCTCDGRAPKILNPVKIHKDLTILTCFICQGEVARWEKKIYPPDLDFSKFDLEDMT